MSWGATDLPQTRQRQKRSTYSCPQKEILTPAKENIEGWFRYGSQNQPDPDGKMLQKYTAGLTNKTEKALAAKVGHLEMLRGGKQSKGVANRTKDGKTA